MSSNKHRLKGAHLLINIKYNKKFKKKNIGRYVKLVQKKLSRLNVFSLIPVREDKSKKKLKPLKGVTKIFKLRYSIIIIRLVLTAYEFNLKIETIGFIRRLLV